MLPYLIAGAIGFVVAKLFEEDEAPKYADGGSVLLAPNGKPSKLTPEQYKLVRTPAFKKWFGDWENSPETASKIVDSNGEPLVCYHGTLFEFNIFEKTIFGKFGKGIYFTSYIDSARKYAKNYENSRVIPVFLKSIKLVKTEKIFIDQIKDLPNDYDCIWSRDEDNEELEYEYQEPDEIVVYTPNQIKLADGSNTTFDGNNPDIRFDEGGKIREIDIDVDAIRVSDEIGYFDDFVFNELEEDEILEGFVIKYYYTKEIGLVNVQDDKFELGVGYIWGLQVFEEYKGKGFGKKIMEKIFILHPTQYAFRGTTTKKSKGFWLNLGAEFDESDEYSFILSKDKLNYSDGGSVLLAPNGNPSYLTPEQYKLVRSQSFKAWFGDWEKAYETGNYDNVSKVIGYNVKGFSGEPLICSHSSYDKFNQFKTPTFFQEGEGGGAYGDRSDEDYVNYNVFLNIKNLLELRGAFLKDKFTPLISEIYKNAGIDDDEYKNRMEFAEKYKDGYGLFKLFEKPYWKNEYGYNWEWVFDYCKKNGYDGFVMRDSDQSMQYYITTWVALYSNQIKLADGTNTTFDGNNPDIIF